eukprot:6897470-Prymnesium_polylepis.1
MRRLDPSRSVPRQVWAASLQARPRWWPRKRRRGCVRGRHRTRTTAGARAGQELGRRGVMGVGP